MVKGGKHGWGAPRDAAPSLGGVRRALLAGSLCVVLSVLLVSARALVAWAEEGVETSLEGDVTETHGVAGMELLRSYGERRFVNPGVETVELVASGMNLDASSSLVAVNGEVVTPSCLDATYTYAIDLSLDGAYRVEVRLLDESRPESSVTESVEFVVDCECPVVSVMPEGEPAGRWSTTALRYLVTIEEENLDEELTTVFGHRLRGILAAMDEGEAYAVDGLRFMGCRHEETDHTYRLDVAVTGYKADDCVIVHAVDLAGNTGDSEPQAVRVDTRAPTVQGAYVSAESFVVHENGDGEKELLINQPGTALTIEVSDEGSGLVDEAGNVGVSLIDPTGAYREAEVSPGEDGTIVATVCLREDAPFEDVVLIRVVDVAGNVRVWSLSQQGSVVEGGRFGLVENEPLGLLSGQDMAEAAHPARLRLDCTPPVLSLTGAREGGCYQGSVSLRLTVTEPDLVALRASDPRRGVLSITRREGADGQGELIKTYTLGDLATDGSLSFDLDALGDGCFEVSASLTDWAGNVGTASVGRLTVDTTAPVIGIVSDNDDAKEGGFYDAPRVVTVTVRERNFDAGRTSVVLDSTAWSEPQPEVGAWAQSSEDPDLWVVTIPFVSDGTYSLTVRATDGAGNVSNPVAEEAFVIDTTAPEVRVERDGVDFDEVLDRAKSTYDGVTYLDARQTVTITVSDRNLDLSNSAVVVDGVTVGEGDWLVRGHDDGVMTYTYAHVFGETPDGPDGGEGTSATPDVQVVDRAGNGRSRTSRAFVVDESAPTLEGVSIDAAPTFSGSDEGTEGHPIQFFSPRATLTFTVADQHRIASIELCDPSGGPYAGVSAIRRGAFEGTYAIDLADGATTVGNAELGRDILLRVTDIAGNARLWSLGRESLCTGGSEVPVEHMVTINDAGVRPYALVLDATAPVTSLGGVAAGAYYGGAQTVRVFVEELNFGYLRRFDGGRAVVRVVRREPDASAARSTREVTAQELLGAGSDWVWEEALTADGHYAIEVGFTDLAGNASNVSRVDEFTIDTTPPTITVEFDNNDVQNGTHYRATRTATVMVTEHNFDESLVTLETTGQVGSWSSEGDTHRCLVFFGEGAAHSLEASATDLAGNVAQTVEVPEFSVDLTAPQIAFGGAAQRLGLSDGDGGYAGTLRQRGAYNGVVAPCITFADEQGFDSEDVTFTLTGNKVGDVTEVYAHGQSYDGHVGTIQFEDLGRVDEGLAYDIDADDVYTLEACVTDLAGNVAQDSITFSVNRFGSNYLVSLDWGDGPTDAGESLILDKPPTVTIQEINVSGALSEADHHVLKEYANVTSEIERKDGDGSDGYRLDVLDRDDTGYGWAEYVYTIGSGNFGEGSSSDRGDGGQGVYRVDVLCEDAASNVNSTASYWSSDRARDDAQAKVGTVEFTLDEVSPRVDDLELPEGLVPGRAFEASFHVTDAVTRGNAVEVSVDGKPVAVMHEGRALADGELVGDGTFTFTIPARPFAVRDVAIKVTDYAGRSDEVCRGGFCVTTLVPETLVVAGVVVASAVVARLGLYRREERGPHGAGEAAGHDRRS